MANIVSTNIEQGSAAMNNDGYRFKAVTMDNRVGVGRVGGIREVNPELCGAALEGAEQSLDAVGTAVLDHVVQRLEPLLFLSRVDFTLVMVFQDVGQIVGSPGGGARIVTKGDYRTGF